MKEEITKIILKEKTLIIQFINLFDFFILHLKYSFLWIIFIFIRKNI